MGVSERVHVFPSSGGLEQLPQARFERLLAGHPAEHLPEHAGERLRCALTYVELDGGELVGILRTDFLILPLGADGRLDRAEYDRGARLARRMISWLPASRAVPARKVIDVRSHLARKEYEDRFTWSPTDEELGAIADDLFR